MGCQCSEDPLKSPCTEKSPAFLFFDQNSYGAMMHAVQAGKGRNEMWRESGDMSGKGKW